MEMSTDDLKDMKPDAKDLSNVSLKSDEFISNKSPRIKPDPDLTKMEHDEIIPRDWNQNQDELKQEILPHSESISGVKEEIMYCLFCSHSETDFERLKFHIFREHPTGAAVVAHDIEFFCIKETCTFSTTLYNVYEEHLMNCCLLHESLSMVEKQRLNSAFKFILEFHNKHSLSTVSGFLDYVSAFNATLICKDDEVQISKDLDHNNLSLTLSDPVTNLNVSLSSGNIDTNRETLRSSFPTPILLTTTPNTVFDRTVSKVSICEKTSLSAGNIHSLSLSASEQERIPYDEQLRKADSSTSTFGTSTTKGQTAAIPTVNDDIVSGNLDLETDVARSPIFMSSFKEEATGDSVKEEVEMNDGDCCTKDLDDSNQVSGNITRRTTENQPVGHILEVRVDTGHFCGDEPIAADPGLFSDDELKTNGVHFYKNELKMDVGHPPSVDELKTDTGQSYNDTKPDSCKPNYNMKIGEKSFRIHDKQSQCNACDNTFDQDNSLIKHTKTHREERHLESNQSDKISGKNNSMFKRKRARTEEKPFKCQVCCRSFRWNSDLNRHMRTHSGDTPGAHVEEKPFKCQVCYRSFRWNSDLNRHMRTHPGDTPGAHAEEKTFKCQVCCRSFRWKCDLNRHMRTHSGETPFKCAVCGKSFGQKCNLLDHIRRHAKEKPFKCHECGDSFNLNSSLCKHMRKHTGEKLFKCNVCGKSFDHKHNFLHHMRIHTGEKPYTCDVCGKSFCQNSNLSRHMRTHTGEKPYECGVCGKSFGPKFNFLNHMQTHTGEKPFKCGVCDKSFGRKCMFLNHMRTHTGERPFKCDVCGMTFGDKRILIRHRKIHTREKLFTCVECDKSFNQSSSLSRHMRTHTGEKPYKCSVCAKRFSRNNYLIRHMRTHTGEKPFKCDLCGKSFGQKCNFLGHMRTHTGEKQFICDVCDKGFVRKRHFLEHLKTHTREKPI